MRIELIKKIQALANDARGDPATRARAQEKLASLRKTHPDLFHEADIKAKFGGDPRNQWRDVRPDPRVHGMRMDPAYEYFIFSDLNLWDETKTGNKTIVLFHKGVNFRIVLFRHKKTPTWGWMRIDDFHHTTEFSGRFKTIEEAQSDSWASLMAT
jgi:hypothetical protein